MDDYINQFFQYFNEDAQEIHQDIYSLIIPSIEQWLTENSKFNHELEENNKRLLNRVKKEGELSRSSLNEMLKKRNKNLKTVSMSDLLEHFKRGYALLHYIRELLTNQEIQYDIALKAERGDKSKNYHSKNLTYIKIPLKVFLEGLSLEKSLGSFREGSEITDFFELKARESKIRTAANKFGTLQTGEFAFRGKTILWNTLIDYRKQLILEGKLSEQADNWGRTYEVYQRLVHEKKYQTVNAIGHWPGQKNTYGLAEKLFKEQRGESVKGWQMGDIGLEQYKAVFNAAASVMSSSSLVQVMKEIFLALTNNNTEKIKTRLKEIFIPKSTQLRSEIDKEVWESANDAVDRIVGKKIRQIRKFII